MKSKASKSEPSRPASRARRGAGRSEETRSKQLKNLRDDSSGGTSEARTLPKPAGAPRRSGHGNILHYIYKNTLGQSLHSQMRLCLQEPFVRSLSSYHFHVATSPFDRRVTCLEWHPTHPSTLAVASKGGDICLWDFAVPTKQTFIKGMGVGHSVTDMRFNQFNPTQLFISSMGGTTALRDFSGATLTVFACTDIRHALEMSRSRVLQKHDGGAGDFIGGMKFCPTDLSSVYVATGEGVLSQQSFERHTGTVLSRTSDCGHQHHNVCYWYCCVDVSISRRMLVTGDNVGQLSLLGLEGEKIFSNKLHKAKVTHAEFNSRCDWLLATASVDHTVKLWDLRNIKDKTSFLHVLPHEKSVNSAYFNPLDCSKLLTTDQYDEIRVYSSSDWSKPQHIIEHPHRHFQHLTPIKATWHPVYDLIVAGRYPNDKVCPGDQRTIDIFDSNTAELVCQLQDPTAAGIKSINKFNAMGDVIASGMGMTVLVWDRNESLVGDRHKEQEEASSSASSSRARPRSQQPAGRARRAPAADAKLKKKLASLEDSATQSVSKTKSSKHTRRK